MFRDFIPHFFWISNNPLIEVSCDTLTFSLNLDPFYVYGESRRCLVSTRIFTKYSFSNSKVHLDIGNSLFYWKISYKSILLKVIWLFSLVYVYEQRIWKSISSKETKQSSSLDPFLFYYLICKNKIINNFN